MTKIGENITITSSNFTITKFNFLADFLPLNLTKLNRNFFTVPYFCSVKLKQYMKNLFNMNYQL